MSIFRTNDPTQFDDVDGIVVDESAPPSQISGVASNVAILVGQFQRGPTDLTEVGSIGQFHELYGKSSFSGNKQLKNKRFGRLRIARVVATGAVKAFKNFQNSTPADAIKFEAKYPGAYGNGIKVTITAGTVSGKKYKIEDTNPGAVIAAEVYDNIAIADITPATFAGSQLVNVTVLLNTLEPSNIAATALATGADGSVADTDYQTAIGLAAVEGAGNILFLDDYNTTRNGYLKQHAADTQDKMVIVAGPEVQTVASAITDAGLNRDTDGRIIYAYPWIETSIDGALEMTSPASWYASILSQIGPHIDPAFSGNVAYTSGITSMKYKNLTRADYIQLKDAGVSAFEFDADLGGFKPKSGVTTQILSSAKVMIFRRRMADYLTASIAKFLKNYQNGVNSKSKRDEVKAQILDFTTRSEQAGILPGAKDVKSGAPNLVDTESLNTDSSVALGFFKILYKQRIFSSMRYIVLQAEIGESVVVTEQEG